VTDELQRQIAELRAVHKGLTEASESEAGTVVSGKLPFEASADGLESIVESFDVELTIPRDFPETLPTVKEIGGRIEADYQHRNPSGTLCLAVPIEQRRLFLEQPTLLGFVNRLVIPYFYGYCYFKKHGRHPFDEAAHGHEGILRHYLDTLGLRDELTALRIISFLIDHGYRGHHECPCGSGRTVRACHGPALLALHRTHNKESLKTDFAAIFGVCFPKFERGELSFPAPLRRQLLRIIGGFSKV